MAKNKERKWLKKYTPLKHLRGIIESASLFLADEKKRSNWPDKNDTALLDEYVKREELDGIGVTCMTQGSDRHHFWHSTNEEKLTVCLWFDKAAFIEELNLQKSENLIFEETECLYISQLAKNKHHQKPLPFMKRRQYSDEKEYRIIRKYPSESNQNTELKFKKSSLKCIYFDSKLERKQYDLEYKKYREILNNNGYDRKIELLQNKLLRHEGWIEAAFNATK